MLYDDTVSFDTRFFLGETLRISEAPILTLLDCYRQGLFFFNGNYSILITSGI